jgi:hypothetical protein
MLTKASEVMNPLRNLDAFTRAYIECALWSSADESTPEGGEPMDANYSWTDLAESTLQAIMDDCAAFQRDNADDIDGNDEQAGHDFWLTRNHHGAGFWDRGKEFYPDGAGKRLTNAAHAYGECTLCVGDDGKIYA